MTPPSSARAAGAIAALQLRRRIRDRSVLVQGIVAPIVLAVIIAAAFGGDGARLRFGVVDLDGGAIGATVVDGAESLEVIPYADRAAAVRAIDDEDLAAAIVIPEGFAASLLGDPLAIEVLVEPGSDLSAALGRGVASQVAAQVDASRLVVGTAVLADASLVADPGTAALATEAAAISRPVAVGAGAFGEAFDPITYFAPSMAILFAFLTLGGGARAILVERREGTLARVRSTPTSDRAVLVGTTGSVVAVGLVSFVVVWLVTGTVFGARWGAPLLVLAVIIATVISVAGISTLVAGSARTEAQADGVSSVLAFGFALLGGGFLAPGSLPGLLDRLAQLTPNRWALDAFAELGAGASDLSTIAPSILVLTGVGLATGALGLRLVRLGAR